MPVVADGLDAADLALAVGALRAPPEDHEHQHQAADHVEAVESGHAEEERAVGVRGHRERERRPVVGLRGDEPGAQQEGEDDPPAHRAEAPAPGRADRHLERPAR